MRKPSLVIVVVATFCLVRTLAEHGAVMYNGFDISPDSPARHLDPKPPLTWVSGAETHSSVRLMSTQDALDAGVESEPSPLGHYIFHSTEEGLSVHQLKSMFSEQTRSEEGFSISRQGPGVFHVVAPHQAVWYSAPSSQLQRAVKSKFLLQPLAKLASPLQRQVFPSTETTEQLCWDELTVHLYAPKSLEDLEGMTKQDPRWEKVSNTSVFECGWRLPRQVAHKGVTRAAYIRCRPTKPVPSNMSLSEPIAAPIKRCWPSSAVVPLFTYLAHLPMVRWIEPRQRFEIHNNVATVTLQDPSGTDRPLWAHAIAGEGQIGQVGDTGLDYDSCYFRDDQQSVAFYPGSNPAHRKVLSYVQCDDYNSVDHGDKFDAHGTHVSGSVAGNSLSGDSVSGPARFNGIAKNAKLVFGDMNCGGEDGVFPPGDIRDFYAPGHELGASVSSNSWGTRNGEKSYSATERNSDDFAYSNLDFLLVYAAGNYAMDGIITPSSGKNMLTVGAHENSLQAELRDHMSGFSAIGPTWDGRIKPEVVAPGHSVTSAKSDGKINSNQCETSSKAGTSMATPLVAGSALLLRQYLTEGYYPRGAKNASAGFTPTASLLKAALIQATVNMGGQEWPGKSEGFGRLELQRLMFLQDIPSNANTKPYTFMENNRTIRQGQRLRYCFFYNFQAQNAKVDEIRASLVWTDPASTPEGSTGKTLINDLDVVLLKPDGGMVRSNGKTSDYDRTNNAEVIRLGIAQNGMRSFAVEVYAHEIVDEGLYGGQPFSLVVWAPDLSYIPAEQDTTCTSFACPNSCSGHGQCVQGTCQCTAPFSGVDCGLCNGALGCHGNSKCEASTGLCSCPSRFDTTIDKTCGTCAYGWYGPACDSDCKCGPHGSCDTVSGDCQCHYNSTHGHWGGDKCDRCAFDYYGTECNQRSSWCTDKHPRLVKPEPGVSVGYIQLNGEGHYSNGMTCTWHIQAASPEWRIRVRLVWFDVEKDYDHLYIYDGSSKTKSSRIADLDGTITSNKEYTSHGANMLLIFASDYVGTGNGFTLQYTILKSCNQNTCNGHGHCGAQETCICDEHFDATYNCDRCSRGWTGNLCDTPATAVPPPTQQPETLAPSRDAPTTLAPGMTSAPTTTTQAPVFTTTLEPEPSTAAPTPTVPCRSPGSEKDCNGVGWCAKNRCICDGGYAGPFCEKACPSDSTGLRCSGHGICNENADCLCETGYFGGSCHISENTVAWLNSRFTTLRLNLVPDAFSYFGYRSTILDGGTETIVLTVNVYPVPQRDGRAPMPVEVAVWDDGAASGSTNGAILNGTVKPAMDVGSYLSSEEVLSAGPLCLEVHGWSKSKVTPSIVGVRTTGVNQSVIISVTQRIIPKCGATSNSVCSASLCNSTMAALSGSSSNIIVGSTMPLPEIPIAPAGSQVSSALNNTPLVVVSVLLGICSGVVFSLVLHLVRWYLHRQGRGYESPTTRPEVAEAAEADKDGSDDEEMVDTRTRSQPGMAEAEVYRGPTGSPGLPASTNGEQRGHSRTEHNTASPEDNPQPKPPALAEEDEDEANNQPLRFDP